MKKLALALVFIFGLIGFLFAGPETFSGKEMKQVVPPPCPEWYGDQEWNIAVWGAYAFGEEEHHGNTFEDALDQTGDGFELQRGVIGDEGWGGGIDIKYFFHRYFGIGLEGYVLRTEPEGLTPGEVRLGFSGPEDTVGALKGTITFRYPFHCSRFAPYIYAGGGALFGVERQRLVFPDTKGPLERDDDDDPRAVGEVGGGFEVRFTRHIGWINDVSWNFTEDDNFGMVRSGVNFAF
jgi:opacity protein-like surface antigen